MLMEEADDTELRGTHDIDKYFENESALSAMHPHSDISPKSHDPLFNKPFYDVRACSGTALKTLYSTASPKQVRPDATTLNNSYNPRGPEKDIGDVQVSELPHLPLRLNSVEREVLHDIKAFIGDKTASEFELQFARCWIFDKSIAAEKKNYDGAYEEVALNSLPSWPNVISFRHLFQGRTDGEKDKLRLKCGMVPHGNRDKTKKRSKGLCNRPVPHHRTRHLLSLHPQHGRSYD